MLVTLSYSIKDKLSYFLLFSNFPRPKSLFLPKFFHFILKNSDDFSVVGYFSTFSHISTPSPFIHHCKNTLSSLHTFVHHCTFCASLHVKTCPVTSEDR